MSEYNPSIVKIERIENHPNADNLCIYYVLGDYPVIGKIGEYKINDLAAYIPVDAIVPDTGKFYFLCPKSDGKPKYQLGSVPEKYRIIKAKKLRGIYSEGLLVSAPEGMNLGDSIIERLQIKKWEEDEEDNLKYSSDGIFAMNTKGGNAEKPPQHFSIPYYDIEGLRKHSSLLNTDEHFVVMEKIHGSNASYCYDGDRLWVKSRRFFKQKDENDMWWDIAFRYQLEDKLSKYPMYVFFGEIYGQINKFRYDCVVESGKLKTKIRFFDIYDAKSHLFLNYDKFKEIITELGLDSAPEMYIGPWLGKDDMYKLAEGISNIGSNIKEGFVIKPITNRFEKYLNGRMILKHISEAYKLQK